MCILCTWCCVYLHTRIWFLQLVYARTRILFPECVRNLGTISVESLSLSLSDSFALRSVAFVEFAYLLPFYISLSPPRFITRFLPRFRSQFVRCPFCLPFFTKLNYINNYLSITLYYILVSPFNATARLIDYLSTRYYALDNIRDYN